MLVITNELLEKGIKMSGTILEVDEVRHIVSLLEQYNKESTISKAFRRVAFEQFQTDLFDTSIDGNHLCVMINNV